MRRNIIIAFGLCICLFSHAQVYKGFVKREDGTALEFANVVVLHNGRFLQGCTTDKTGAFQLKLDSTVNRDSVMLHVSRVGFETMKIKGIKEDVELVMLHKHTTALHGVTVKGTASAFKLQDNVLIADIAKSALRNVGDASKVLGYLPGVYPDEDGFKVFGKGKAAIYLNGRILHDMSELQRIKSTDLTYVEILHNPGAEYDASASAVIKVHTRRKTDEGVSVTATSYYQQAYKPSFQEMAQVVYHHHNLDVFGTLNYIKYTNHQEGSLTYNLLTKNPATVEGHASEQMTTKQCLGKVGFDYYLNKHNSIGGYYSYNHQQVKGGGGSQLAYSDKQLSQETQRYLNSHSEEAPAHRASLYYAGHIGKMKVDINNEYYHQNKDADGVVDEDIIDMGKRKVTTHNDLANRFFVSQAKAAYKTGWGEWTSGIEYMHTKRENVYSNFEGIIDDDHQQAIQHRYAAFSSLIIPVHKLKVNMGLRYEFLDLDYVNTMDVNRSFYRKWSSVYPTLSLSLPVKKVSMGLSYSKKIVQPTYGQLDGNVIYSSRHVYKEGNIALEPEFVHDINYSLFWKGLFVNMDYVHKNNALVSDFQLYDGANNILLSTYGNYPKATELSAGISYSKTLFGIWTPSISMNISTTDINLAKTVWKAGHFQKMYGKVSFSSYFVLPHEINIFLFARYVKSGYEGGLYQRSSGLVSLDFVKTWKHWTLDILCNDIFKMNKTRYGIYTPVGRFDSSFYHDHRNIQITLTYRFNTRPSRYKGQSVADGEINRL